MKDAITVVRLVLGKGYCYPPHIHGFVACAVPKSKFSKLVSMDVAASKFKMIPKDFPWIKPSIAIPLTCFQRIIILLSSS